MQTQVIKRGNSQGIRLSKDIPDSAGIRTDEILELTASNRVIILEITFQHKTLEESVFLVQPP